METVTRQFPSIYLKHERQIEALLRGFIELRIKKLTKKENETQKAYQTRALLVFSGVVWRIFLRKIVAELSKASIEATKVINGSLEEAYADGMNSAAYSMFLSGIETWPITTEIVANLVAAKVIQLTKREVNKEKDASYNEQRTRSAISSAIVQGIAVTELAARIANHIVNARMAEMRNYARTTVYSASDSGAYAAGKEAEQQGLNIEKTWLSVMDMRVRPSHNHLHGTTIPIDEMFQGYDGELMYPHDPNAPPSETYRCRCRMIVHLAGRYTGDYSKNMPPAGTSAYRRWRDNRIRKAGNEIELEKLHKRRLNRR